MKKKNAPMTAADVDRLATSTEDAYSFDRYANWHACARMLARRGYTYAEAECILRSKWMRWAGNASNRPLWPRHLRRPGALHRRHERQPAPTGRNAALLVAEK